MIVLDTNVVSEVMRPAPEPRVIGWLDQHRPADLYLTTLTLAELRYGLAALPQGRRQAALVTSFEQDLLPLYEGRILTFDEPASRAYARLKAAARAAGQPRPDLDLMIASICAAHGFALATRNVDDFAGTGIEVIDPWTETA